MNDKVLVAYASRSGSTAEIAHAIGKTLMEGGAVVDVLPMVDVKDLAPYRAIVVGSAVQKSKWLPEAVAFVEHNRATLLQKPCAMFTACITIAMSNTEQYRSAVSGWVAPVRMLINPISEAFFAGRVEVDKLPRNLDGLKMRFTVAVGIFPKEDRRDWNAIREWAVALRSALGVQVAS